MKRKRHQAVAALLLGLGAAIGLYILHRFTPIQVADPVENRGQPEAQVPEAERGAFGLYRHALDAVMGEYRGVLLRRRPEDGTSRLERVAHLGYEEVGDSMEYDTLLKDDMDDTIPAGVGYSLAQNFHSLFQQHATDGTLGILLVDFTHLRAAEETLGHFYQLAFAAENPFVFHYDSYIHPPHVAQFCLPLQTTPVQTGRQVIVYGDVDASVQFSLLMERDFSDVNISSTFLLPSPADLANAGIRTIVVGVDRTPLGSASASLPPDYGAHDKLRAYFEKLKRDGFGVSFHGIR